MRYKWGSVADGPKTKLDCVMCVQDNETYSIDRKSKKGVIERMKLAYLLVL